MGLVLHTVNILLNALSLAILASVILSWLPMLGVRVPRWHPVVRLIEGIADILLRPIWNLIPATAMGLDFSPFIALLLIQIVQRVIAQAGGRLL